MTDQVPLVATTEDFPHKAPERRQSSEIVTAAAEVNMAQRKAMEKKEEGGDGEADAKNKYVETIHSCQTLEKDEVARIFQTDLKKGLASGGQTKTVEELRAVFGYNELTPKYQHPWYIKLLLSIFSGEFNILLWVGSILCFIAYAFMPTDPTNLYLGIVLAVVVTITGIFGYFQESKSSDITASFATFAVEEVNVTRRGNATTVEPRELVPGDLVSLFAGDMIPADIRITECSSDSEVNNASLTGESDPISRAWVPEDNPPLEAKNMCFFGTHLMKGKVSGIVVATGDQSFMGTVASLAKETANVETPIAKEIRDFVHKVSAIAFVLGVLFFVLGMINNGEWIRNLVFLIGIIVANVPEGLLATVTVSLTLTATRMAYKNVQVKNLESVETLGSTSVICSDKTGTLTTSIMTVKHVLFDITPVEAPTSGSPTLEIQGKGTLYDYVGDYPNIKPSFHRLLRIGLLCNNAKMVYNEASGEKKIVGDATESAVFKYCNAHVTRQWQAQDSENRQKYAERNPEQAKRLSATALYRESFPQLHQIPFNSANKWQISIHKQEAGKYSVGDDMPEFEIRPIIVLKGAPEKVLDMCETYLDGGVEKPLTPEVQAAIVAENEKLAREGERVLGFADMELDPAEYDISLPEPAVIMCNDGLEAIDVPGVYVKWGGDNIAVPLQNTYTHGDRAGQVKQVLDHTFKELYEEFAKLVDKQAGSIRISFNDPKEWMDYDVKLKDAKVRFEDGKASVLAAQEGPYRFIGNSRKECNWPFGRTDMNGERVERGLCFVGFYAMIDPPRATVPGAVLKCKEAGIKVIMVTGDHPTTANAIAKQVNIVGTYDDDFDWSPYRHKPQKYHMTKQDIAEVEGIALEQVAIDDPRYMCALVPGQKSKHTIKGWTLQEKELEGDKHPEKFIEFWNEVLTKESVVFARTSPEQKLRIVEACQLRGGIVAVTGDGVNDSPALKKADIGVAMGITGTDVAKETADMILKDDNFASIVNGVEEGRIIFDNLKKSIAYTLSSNIPEISPFIMYQLLMIPLPLSTVMILLVDLGTDLAPAISLAHEDSELDIMERSPRDQHTDKLVTMRLISFSYLQIGCIQALAGFYAYMVVLWSYGLRPEFLVGLDSNSLYEWKSYDFRDGKNQYEGFWLYCFEDTDEDCLYGPDPSVFDCWWDDNRVWDDDLSNQYKYAKPPSAANDNNDCKNTQNTKKNSIPFGEWYGENDDWIEDWVDKVTEVYKNHVESQSTTVLPIEGTNCVRQTFAIVEDVSGADVDYAGFTPMQQALRRCYAVTEPTGVIDDTKIKADWGCAVVLYDPNAAADAKITTYKGSDCKASNTKMPAGSSNFVFNDDKGNYRRPKAKYLWDYTAWDRGYGTVSQACKDGGCKLNTNMFRAYTVAVYELMPFETYTTSVYPERDCWDEALDSFKIEVGAKYYGSNYEEGSGESQCDRFVDEQGKGLMTWSYWSYNNADCTTLAACISASSDLTGHTASSDMMDYGTLFPLQMTDRYYALRQSNSAYFISIIVVQWADLMICKTRVRSLFEQGMTNVFMNYSLFFETALGALLVYLPVANTVTATAPLKFVWWCAAVPFSILIYTYDELRKGYIRAAREAGTGSWLEKNTYW